MILERLIPRAKLSTWIESSKNRPQRKARMRWTVAYLHGASFTTMSAMARMPLTPEGISRVPEISHHHKEPA